MTRQEVESNNLGDVVQERLYKAGAAPGITSREILSRGPACPTKWKEPRRSPTEEERRKMLGIMVETAINMCMNHHFYMHEEKVKRQGGGAGIGLRLEVMDRQNSSRPEVVQTRRVREQDKVPDGDSGNTTRHSLKSQVTNCFFISTYIMPEHSAGVDHIKQ